MSVDYFLWHHCDVKTVSMQAFVEQIQASTFLRHLVSDWRIDKLFAFWNSLHGLGLGLTLVCFPVIYKTRKCDRSHIPDHCAYVATVMSCE